MSSAISSRLLFHEFRRSRLFLSEWEWRNSPGYPVMEFCVALLVIVGGSYLIAALGRMLPAARDLGVDVLLAVLVPSYLVYAGWIGPDLEAATRTMFQGADIIGVFITVLIVGSICAIPRRLLLVGAAKVAFPLVLGSLAALGVGVGVGILFGVAPLQTLMFKLLPIMSGGISTGVLPLSVGYGSILAEGNEGIVAMLLPPVIFGNLIALLCGGIFRFVSERYGKRILQASDAGPMRMSYDDEDIVAPTRQDIVVAATLLAAFYLVGVVGFLFANISVPLTVLVLAGLLKVTDATPAGWRRGILAIYDAVVRFVTFPIVFAVGLLFTPWTGIVEGLSAANLCIIGSAILTLGVSGYFISRFIGLDPFDGAVVTLTRGAMGGTGALAILVASRRVYLMPFALISTRVGGAITLAAALLLAARYGG
jgi:Na+/citrate or Na+/malate symporter